MPFLDIYFFTQKKRTTLESFIGVFDDRQTEKINLVKHDYEYLVLKILHC